MTANMSPEAMVKQTRQKLQETDMERRARKQGDFLTIESKMPILSSRRKASMLDKLTSLLGSRNPLSHAVNPKFHNVWLLDNTAWKGPGNTWNAEVVAAYFVKNSGEDESEIVAQLCEVIGIAKDDAVSHVVADRIQPLLDTVLPAHTVRISLGDQRYKLGPSSRDGISTDIVSIHGDFARGQIMTPQIFGMDCDPVAKTFFADSTGWGVISDIDDTIKKTMTASAIGILRTTFVETPEPIAGMPELYQHIKLSFKDPPFWYLSASPYNLYPFLREFRDNANYPHGTLILRDASWMNLSGLLASVTQGTQAYKVDRMEKIYSCFPQRKFLCIGDSTQSDPEAYGELYRRHAGWVGAVFIRRVTGVAEMDEKEKNSPDRFKRAFKGMPDDIWHVFDDPTELYERVDALVVA